MRLAKLREANRLGTCTLQLFAKSSKASKSTRKGKTKKIFINAAET